MSFCLFSLYIFYIYASREKAISFFTPTTREDVNVFRSEYYTTAENIIYLIKIRIAYRRNGKNTRTKLQDSHRYARVSLHSENKGEKLICF